MPPLTTNPLEQAETLLSKGKLDQAQKLIKQVIRQAPDSGHAYHLAGLVAYQRGDHEQATRLLSKAIDLEPNDCVIHHNAGLAWVACERLDLALTSFSQATGLDPGYAQAWLNRGNVYRHQGEQAKAQADYHQALTIDPFLADAHNNLGLSFREAGNLTEAISHFEQCLGIEPNHCFAMNNLALALQALGERDKARALFESAIQIAPNYVVGHINLGHLLQQEGDFSQAAHHYQIAYKLSPKMDLLAGYLVQAKAMICDWSGLDHLWRDIERAINAGAVACSPFALLSGSGKAPLSLRLAKAYVARHVPTLDVPTYQPKRQPGKRSKLRIGYLSSDFKEHPVAYLTVGIIENHQRDQVDLFGFAISKPGDGPLGTRIREGFDQFIDLSAKSDVQAVEVLRSYDLDILMDITGFTEGCRPSILKARVAPIQVNYYGYAGTMGADFIDYIVGDHYLMPPGSEDFYQEKIIYMPECHQPNDDKREISQTPLIRSEHGLPAEGFVYCSFNKPYKISPKVFETWMRIIKAVDGSVLWLQSTDPIVIENLKKNAKRCGVDPARLIFAGRTPTTAEHLARYRLADLFLDTFPYTAHTTANDALWAGLPVLGLSGQTFAARVSESLLSTLGLSDLVMHSLQEFETKAIEIGRHPEQLAHYREQLDRGKAESSLYKPKQLAAWLEKGLRIAYERYETGQAPEHIIIAR
ncbi:O-linked N-acetylglucosamine transferase, SPINDLY family protein [Orrella daihaiensis]|uniref:protein O-GlcNAc transferase n=1 Tax=Orrella daihaiensis TaxID=2782176 RepID=A0ABY4AMI9_9BURK|nr:tetratricopeptide repeat protein [Orrella daihaiensis]UOD51168.1 tetratricopeptide repeat protein [Orrella daihaiensis]